MFRFPALNLAQWSLAETTPGCTAPSTRACSRISPRRLKTRTVSPSAILRAWASAALISSKPGFFHLLDDRHIAKSGVQKVVRLAGQQLQRERPAPANCAAIPSAE